MSLVTRCAVVVEDSAMSSIPASTWCDRAEGSMVCEAGSHGVGISLDSTRIKHTTRHHTKTSLGGGEGVVDSAYVYFKILILSIWIFFFR